MRFATFIHQGLRQVGQVAADGRTVTALNLAPPAAARGMLSVIEQLAAGGKLPA
ncbi:MAG: fumarylacetoacetate hydrolase family protein, partial [Ramlibacter sp.]|nr:fumarylacetoacetate hydrolase family protein [Ramlibacter sp.]